MATLKATFKVHRVEARGLVDGKATEERVLLHPIDPHEPGVNDFCEPTRSGLGQIKWCINAPEALGRFEEGQLIQVSFEIPDNRGEPKPFRGLRAANGESP